MKEQLLKQELKGGGIMDKDIKYISNDKIILKFIVLKIHIHPG